MTSRDGFNIFTCKVVKQRQRLTFTTKLQVYKTLVLSVLIAIDMILYHIVYIYMIRFSSTATSYVTQLLIFNFLYIMFVFLPLYLH